MAAGAVSFLALGVACAEGTNPNDPLGPDAAGSAAGGTEAGNAGTATAGSTSPPTAGTPSTGGSATAGSGGKPTTAGAGGVGGAGGSGGSGGSAGKGGSGGSAGKGGSGGSAGSSGGVGGSSGGAGGAGGMAGGGAGGVAGIAGSGGMAGSGGATSTGFRYAKLVATSEQSGKVWSSVAELQIMTTAGVALSRTNWTVTADSQETDDQTAPATAAIDGDTATFWHTAWEPAPNDVNDPALPHSLIVDLKTTQPITGFSYLPRQSLANGRIKDWQFFVSKDGTVWGTAVKTGTFPNVATLQTVTF